ncbi:type VII secretion protein EccCa [uncultured Corynebacterium sp.]|uniref:type VII secretion protein EccCa n=1 Tax=uncultured Corynebacterium sp. TaxID=159447 RepID=UPI0025DEF543|nr:type VII secretion protein EccCa [uncultured Corynebacterium sp.]
MAELVAGTSGTGGGGWDASTRPPRVPGPDPRAGDIRPDPPPEAPEPKPVPLMRALLPVVMLVAVVGMVAVMVVSGAARNPITFMFPLLMVVSTLGMLAGGGAGATDVGPARRDYQRHLASVRRAVADAVGLQRASVVHRHPDPGDVWTFTDSDRLWERRPDDDDFGAARIGTGPHQPATPVTPPTVAAPEKLDPVSAVALRHVVRTARSVPDLPVAVDVTAFPVLSVGGDPAAARALVRAMVAQLAVAHHPAELAIAVVGVGPDWEWVKWLPHNAHPGCSDAAGPLRLRAPSVAALEELFDGHPGTRAIVVVAEGRDLDAAPEQLERLVSGWAPPTAEVTAIVVPAESSGPVAALAVARGLALTVTGGRVLAATAAGDEDIAAADALGPAAAEALARRLAGRHPGRVGDSGGPRRDPVLAELSLDPPPTVLEFRPRRGPERLRVPIGVDEAGRVVHLDLKESAEGGVGPHGLCIGATGSGKSELLKSIVLALAATHGPDQLNFVLVDFKGGATFLGLDGLPHVSAVITNLADELILVDRMQDAIRGEMTRRQELLRSAGNFPGVAEYEAARRAGRTDLKPLPALVIVVDEFSELLGHRPEFAELFVAVGRLGRSLHMHLLLASQRLEEGRLRGLDSHLSYRIGLKTFSSAESRSVLGVPDAHHLPATPGAGFLKTDSGAPLRFHSAYVSGPVADGAAGGSSDPEEGGDRRTAVRVSPFTAMGTAGSGVFDQLDVDPLDDAPVTPESAPRPRSILAATVAAVSGHPHSAHRVWLPPLPERTPIADVADADLPSLSASIGLVDRPLEQRQDPLVVDLSGTGGHVAVVGAPRSGKSTAVRTLLASLAVTTPARALHVHVIDYGAGGLADLAALPHVASVAHRGDVEKLNRVISAVAAEVARREERHRVRGWHTIDAARAAGEPDVLLAIDGWPALRQEHANLGDRVQSIISDGLAVGVHVGLTAHRWTELRPAVRDLLGTRIELRQAESIDSVVDRKAARLVPESPGRGLAPDGCAALIAHSGPSDVGEIADACRGRGDAPVPPLRLLPARVPWEAVAGAIADGAPVPVGVDEDGLEPVLFDVARDRHLLVFGSAGSGRTTALRTVIAGLSSTRPRLKFLVVDYRRGLLDAVPADRLAGYAGSPAVAEPLVAELAAALRARLPGPDVSPDRLRARDWWDGPDIAVVVDDYDLVAGSRGSPLQALGEFIPHAGDIGLHVILARRTGGATRALHDPVLGAVKDQGAAGLILDGSRDDGPLLGVALVQRIPGRGAWVEHGRRPKVLHVVSPPAAAPGARPVGAPAAAKPAATTGVDHGEARDDDV